MLASEPASDVPHVGVEGGIPNEEGAAAQLYFLAVE